MLQSKYAYDTRIIYYHYTYDSVGKRLTETTQLSTKNYAYDEANRLTSVDGVVYTWDANGNLLNDGVNTYVYDSANRLISVNNAENYSYNGLGDRLSVNGVHYTLDINSGLTQVLADGTNTYTYGLGRISQTNTSTEYFLGDALGSVRQLTASNGDVTLSKAYDPYGVITTAGGTSQTVYGFTGEYQGDSTELIYLRARYYNPADGRFQSRDTWAGNYSLPVTLNRFNYAHSNPVMYTDASGNCVDVLTGTLCAAGAGMLIGGGANLMYQLNQNGGNWQCVDWSEVAVWGAGGAMAGMTVYWTLPVLLASPDTALDLASIAYDVYTGDMASLALDATGLMLPGVTGLGAASKVDDVLRAANSMDNLTDAARVANQVDSLVGAGRVINTFDNTYDSARFTHAGSGGYWHTIDEARNINSVQQLHQLSCGAACGEMVLSDRGINISQSTLLTLTGMPTDVEQLAFALNQYDASWHGAFLDPDNPIDAINYLNSRGSWIAQMNGTPIDHFVVVDGIDELGNIMIRDPYERTSYSMYLDDFLEYWKAAVWR